MKDHNMEQLIIDFFISMERETRLICSPLKQFGITFFAFAKTYKDYSQVNFSTHGNWLQYLFTNNLHYLGSFDGFPEWYRSGYAIWSSLIERTIFEEGYNFGNIGNGITITRPTEDGCEFFHFGSDIQNETILNFYFNNLDLLNRFISYFKEKTLTIINQAPRFQIPAATDSTLLNQIQARILPLDIYNSKNSSIEEFIQNTAMKHYYLTVDNRDIRLSKREVDCLRLLTLDDTAEANADQLFISRRTVEKHINNIKYKIGCHTKHGLISKILEKNILL